MKKDDMEKHLLFTVDARYIRHLLVALTSLSVNDAGIAYHIHIICNEPGEENREKVTRLCAECGYGCTFYKVSKELFADAPVNKRYPKEMYYRMLAGSVLPEAVEKIVYLDPDILIINPLHPLWDIPMEGNLFLGATHLEYREGLQKFDQMRLGTENSFFNTGVLVMDLKGMRREVKKEDIFDCISQNSSRLILPDQDVFNILYGMKTKSIPDEIWNYDARRYAYYLSHSSGRQDEKWVMEYTVVLHFCGKAKPWNERYPYRFGHLYLHYMNICRKRTESL